MNTVVFSGNMAQIFIFNNYKVITLTALQTVNTLHKTTGP